MSLLVFGLARAIPNIGDQAGAADSTGAPPLLQSQLARACARFFEFNLYPFLVASQHRHLLNEIEAETPGAEDHDERARRLRDEKNAFLVFFADSHDRIVTAQSEMK